MADDLKTILLSVVLRQNKNLTTSPSNAFNLNNQAVQAYLTQKLKGILPNASGAITENELMTAWLLANSGGGAGSVTSVGLSLPSIFTVTNSPVTSAGTLTGTLVSQSANTVFAGPSSGAAAAPTFRALTPSDLPTDAKTYSFGLVIDGGGNPIVSGIVGDVIIPVNMTITGWTLVADQVGSIVIDLWKDTYANFPPTVLDTITGSEKPTLSSVNKNQDLTLTTWTTAVTAGDIVRFNVDSASTVTRITLSIIGTL